MVDMEEPLPIYVESEGDENCITALPSSPNESPDGESLSPKVTKEGLGSKKQNVDAVFDTAGEEGNVYLDQDDPNNPAPSPESSARALFVAIENGQDDVIAILIERNLVTANTKNQDGKTPLLAAVATRNVRIVQELVDFGAEPDAFGVEVRPNISGATRTVY
jgi:ankyrin repeat protein